ncbi:MAG TPA: hypothetical protein VEQ65_01705 [Opitutus sp.]|nr:hypothetical protein [Opitutus sp.]
MHAPALLAEKITFVDRDCGLSPEGRLAALEKLSRFVERHAAVARLAVEMERKPQGAAPEEEFIAKGELELGGPGTFTSVGASDPLQALEFLLAKFERQLRRHRGHSARMATVPALATP